jgi:CubicO group peptidase (beta-lactamase class C family)
VAAARPTTIQDLLTHTSGIAYGFNSTPSDTLIRAFDLFRAERTLQGFADTLAHIPLVFQPGSRWLYGPGLEVLGRVIEVASGQPYDRYLEQEIFQPLRMESTGFRITPEIRTRVVTLYERGEDRPLRPVQNPVAADSFEPGARFICAGCGILSTLPDYLRFAQMLLNGGELDGVRILRPETVALIRTNVLPPEMLPIPSEIMGEGYGHGLGVAVQVGPPTPDNPTPPGTFGWPGAASTYTWIDPEHDLITMVWTQHFPFFAHPRMRTTLKQLVYSALEDR